MCRLTLVLSALGTTTNDVRSTGSLLGLDGEGVLADGDPPDVLDGAGT